MHLAKIKNKVVVTALMTTIVASNVGMVVNADTTIKNVRGTSISKTVENTKPSIYGEDLYVELGSEVDLKEGLKAIDYDGTVITDSIVVEGIDSIDTTRENRQTVVYKVTNSKKETVYMSRNIHVVKKVEVNSPKVVVDEYGMLRLEDMKTRKSFATNKFTNKEWDVNYFDIEKTESDVEFILDADSTHAYPLMDIKQGDKVIASELLNDGTTISENTYTLELEKDDIFRVDVSVDGRESGKVGRVYIDGELIYDSNNLSEDRKNAYDTYAMVTSELTAGTHEIKFEFVDEGDTTKVDAHRMYIHNMSLISGVDLLEGIISSEKMQYSINGSNWVDYVSAVDLKELVTEDYPSLNIKTRAMFMSNLGEVYSEGTEDSDVEVPLLVKPTIIGDDVTIKVGEIYNELSWVTAKDANGNDISNDIEIVTSNINNKVAGVYNVTYRVVTKTGATAIKTLTVKVEGDTTINNDDCPIINLTQDSVELNLGDNFNPLSYATAYDKKDGDLTNKISVITNNVNTKVAGSYIVVYEVSDSEGYKTTKTLNVVVKDTKNQLPIIYATDKTVTVGSNVNVLEGVTAYDVEDGDITSNIKIISNGLNTQVAGTYIVQLGVTDSSGNSSTKDVVYTVIATDSNTGTNNGTTDSNTNSELPIIDATNIVIPIGKDMAYILSSVTATDSVDGNITSKIKIKSSDIIFGAEGDYKVVFEVTNSRGVTVEKSINVRVSASATNMTTTDGTVINTSSSNTSSNSSSDSTIENVKTFDNGSMYLATFISSTTVAIGALLGKKKFM